MAARFLNLILWLVALALFFLGGLAAREQLVARQARVQFVDSSPVVTKSRSDARAVSGGAGSRASEALKLQANEDFVTSFQDLLPQFENSIVHDDLFLLADVWASRDGEAACQWLAALTLEDERNPYLFSALSQWARQHPQAAVAWFQGQEFAGDQSQDYLIAGLIRGLAASDPAAALDALLAVPESPERSGALDFLVRAWARDGVPSALSQIADLPTTEPALRKRALQKLAGSLTEEQVLAARGDLLVLTSPVDLVTFQVALAARWSQSDPQAAAAWAEKLPSPTAQVSALGQVAARWGRIDPLAASAWLSHSAGEPKMDLAARAVSWSVVGLDPTTAFQQVTSIQSVGLREETFEQVGRFWLSREPVEAKVFLENDTLLPPAIRQSLLQSFR